jgi:hypothetical protein
MRARSGRSRSFIAPRKPRGTWGWRTTPRSPARSGAGGCIGDIGTHITRVPAGHPEGYIEGFANIYSEIAEAIFAHREGGAVDPQVSFPTGLDGEMGMVFIDAAVRSSAAGGIWVELQEPAN